MSKYEEKTPWVGLVTRMEDLGISKEELSDTIGVSTSEIARWMTGEHYPSDENIKCLCWALNIDEEDLKDEVVWEESFDE